MKIKKMDIIKVKNAYMLLIAILLGGCDDVFEFSPYQANVKIEDRGQLVNNIQQLSEADVSNDQSFSFIVIADSHSDYDDLKQAIKKINTLNKIDFVVHLGDMTDHGLLKEFEFFLEYVSQLNTPMLTCIGNHDYLSNGSIIYKSMFGDLNYSIKYKNRKLIFFDATTLESNKQPDMNWFINELNEVDCPKIIFSHIPPGDDQYLASNTKLYSENINNNNNVIISIHGHHHVYDFDNLLNTEVNYLIPGCIRNRKLCMVTINTNNSFDFEMIHF